MRTITKIEISNLETTKLSTLLYNDILFFNPHKLSHSILTKKWVSVKWYWLFLIPIALSNFFSHKVLKMQSIICVLLLPIKTTLKSWAQYRYFLLWNAWSVLHQKVVLLKFLRQHFFQCSNALSKQNEALFLKNLRSWFLCHFNLRCKFVYLVELNHFPHVWT